MEIKTIQKSTLLNMFMFWYFCSQAQGCVETFPTLDNSIIECSNITRTCHVSCASNYTFYDGDDSKSYICNNENVWTPSVPKSGCLAFAHTCIDAHHMTLSENENSILEDVFGFCNDNGSVAFGDILMNNFTSSAQSFDIRTWIEFVITDPSIPYTAVNACALTLMNALKNGGLKIHKDHLECNKESTNITIRPAKYITSEIHTCNDSFLEMQSADDIFCVLDLPVVGVRKLQYVVNIAEEVVLHSDILFGGSIVSVEWLHNNATIMASANTRYNGSTQNESSLTIHGVTHSDSGEYTCLVHNIYGTRSSHSIMLIVLSSSDGETSTEQDTTQKTDTESSVDTETVPTTISTTRRYEKVKDDGADNILYIAIGAGCGGFLIIIIITIVVIKRKGSRRKRQYIKDRKKAQKSEENSELEYDGLKDNILYVQSDDGLKDNILYVPSGEHDITDGNYSSVVTQRFPTKGEIADGNYSTVNLERSPVKRESVDGNYSTVDSGSAQNNVESSKLKDNTTQKTKFENKAFDINDDVKHITAPGGTSNVYAVVDKKKNGSKNTDDPKGNKPEVTYAVVDKTKKN